MARRTTDLITIAIVVGGLLSAAVALRPVDPRDSLSHEVVRAETAAAAVTTLQGLPVRARTIHGDEQAARSALIAEMRLKLSGTANREKPHAMESAADTMDSWPILESDVAAEWSIRQSPEAPRMAVGICGRGGNTLICCWGFIREIGEKEWLVSAIWVAEGD
jgi:hypothetical protein